MQHHPVTSRFEGLFLAAGFDEEWEKFMQEAMWVAQCHPLLTKVPVRMEDRLVEFAEWTLMMEDDFHFFDLINTQQQHLVPAWFMDALEGRRRAIADVEIDVKNVENFMSTILPQRTRQK